MKFFRKPIKKSAVLRRIRKCDRNCVSEYEPTISIKLSTRPLSGASESDEDDDDDEYDAASFGNSVANNSSSLLLSDAYVFTRKN